jgi:carbonic anhydrase
MEWLQGFGGKLILVLGHESCGAIKAAIDNVKLGNITTMLENVKPAVIKAQDYSGDKKVPTLISLNMLRRRMFRILLKRYARKAQF